MRPTSYIVLFVALMFVKNFRGCESFNLHRNESSIVIHFDHDSQEIVETTTVDDDLFDSRENRTVTDSLDLHDDLSLEDAQNATTITENEQLDDIRDGTSLEIFDRSIETTTVDADDHLDHDDDVKQFGLKEVDRDFSSEWKDSAVQPTTNGHTQFESQTHVSVHANLSETVNSESVANNYEMVAVQTSNFDRDDHSVEIQDDQIELRMVEPRIVVDVDSDDVFQQDNFDRDDHSVEIQDDQIELMTVEPRIVADVDSDDIFQQDNVKDFVQPQRDINTQLPLEGPFVHPKSDDWFLVKQYMGDYFFWELEDDVSKDYFWQPFKNATAVLDFIDSSAERLTVEQFAQFTPVQSPMEDQFGSAVVA